MFDGKSKIGVIVVAIIIVSFTVLKFNQVTAPENEITPEENQANVIEQQADTETRIVNYLNDNINEISTTPAILGGTFIINKTSFIDDNKTIITYDDGHNEYVAKIDYEITEDQTISITNFGLLIENGKMTNQDTIITNDSLVIIAIKKSLADQEDWKFENINLELENYNEDYYRGAINILESDINGIFLATIQDGNYITYFSQPDNLPCEELLDNDFPEDLIPECL